MIFRTSAGQRNLYIQIAPTQVTGRPRTELARVAPGQTVAFETDQVDEFLQTGWSVLAVGVLNVMSEEAQRMLAPGQTPDPWAEGLRSVFLQLETSELTGRRVHPA